MENKHIIVGPDDWQSNDIEVTPPPPCDKPCEPDFPPSIPDCPSNPGSDDCDPPLGLHPPIHPPHPPCPPKPPVPPSPCPPNVELGDPCCNDDPRFILKRIILLERLVRKMKTDMEETRAELEKKDKELEELINNKLKDFNDQYKTDFDNLSKNICDIVKQIEADRDALLEKIETLESWKEFIDKIPELEGTVSELVKCCEQFREFITTTAQNFQTAYDKIGEIETKLTNKVNDVDLKADNLVKLINGDNGVLSRMSLLEQRVTNEVKTLNTKLSTYNGNIFAKIGEVATSVSDISDIRNNMAYMKTHSKQVQDWIESANKKFQEIELDIVEINKELERIKV